MMWVPVVSEGTYEEGEVSDISERRAATPDEVSTEEEVKKERSRVYRQRYRSRQKIKEKETQQQVEEAQLELEKLRLEHDALTSQSNALFALSSYSNTMFQTIASTASASAAKARSLGGQAIESVNKFCGWAWHQWAFLPTLQELLAGSAFCPSDEQIIWYLSTQSPAQFFSMHLNFLDRIANILEEGKRSPEAQKYAELRINFSISNWLRFAILVHNVTPQALEAMVCIHQLKALRGQVAAGKYVRPQILQSDPDELVRCVGLDSEQRVRLEEHWQQFVKDIQSARSILGKYTSKVSGGLEAAMETGVYNPSSSKAAAEHFLLATDVANASDEFLLREGRAFIKLWIEVMQVLTPMQSAKVLTSCRPLVPHLPEVLNRLLHGDVSQKPAGSEVFVITDANDSAGSEKTTDNQ